MKFKNFNKKLSKLIGLLLTDGGVLCVSGKWRVHFTSNSKILVDEFRHLMKDLYGLSVATEKRFEATTVRAWINRKVVKELLSLTPSYRTMECNHHPKCPKLNGKKHSSCIICKPKINYPPAKIPDFIFENKNLACNFLKYAISSDGSVHFYTGRARYGFRFDRAVRLCCKHPELRKQYLHLFKKLGFETKVFGNEIIIRKHKNLQKFHKEINFVKGVKIRSKGPWNGFEKSNVLDLCLKSYLVSPSDLGNNENDIRNNLVEIFASGTGSSTIQSWAG